MSEDVIMKNDKYSFSEEMGMARLKANMQHVIQSTVYTCLRGPRPSGAILYISMEHSAGMYPVYGHVVTPYLGIKSCETLGECMMENNHCVRCLHAEVSAIMAAARIGLGTVDGVMFSINKPCYNCSLHIIAAGIKKIYYAYAVYDEDRTREALEVAGVECIHIQVDKSLTVKIDGVTVHDSASPALIVKEITDLLEDVS